MPHFPRYLSLWQIGSDGGFLNEPVRVKQLTMGPAERADVIIDFYGYEGETITVHNSAPVPFNGQPGMASPPAPIPAGQRTHPLVLYLLTGEVTEGFREVLQFRVRRDKGTAPSHPAVWPMMVVTVDG
jgi:FtsP/CotA-like multicopper oxidase with cupredoxin domain